MKRRLAARVAGSVVLAVGTFGAAALPATAAPEVELPEVPQVSKATTMVEAMQRDFGLTKDQVRERLDAEAVASKVEKTLQDSLGGVFGGAYYNAEKGKLVVGVTEQDRAQQIREAGAEARLVDFSAADLAGATDALNAKSSTAPESISGWYTTAKTNTVVLTTAPGTTAQAAKYVQNSGADTDAVKIVESKEDPQTYADVIGGQAYYIGGGRCSVGFSVEGGFVTAGHCGSQGDTTTNPSGSFAGSSFPGNDHAYVQVDAGETPQPLVLGASGTIPVAGSTEAAEGTSICRSGSTTGWQCGTLEAHNQSVSYPQGTVDGLTRTSACAEPGDSGGSFISGDQAQGMTSGGSGNCSSGGTTYYQPVNEALNAYGLTLLTQ